MKNINTISIKLIHTAIVLVISTNTMEDPLVLSKVMNQCMLKEHASVSFVLCIFTYDFWRPKLQNEVIWGSVTGMYKYIIILYYSD